VLGGNKRKEGSYERGRVDRSHCIVRNLWVPPQQGPPKKVSAKISVLKNEILLRTIPKESIRNRQTVVTEGAGEVRIGESDFEVKRNRKSE